MQSCNSTGREDNGKKKHGLHEGLFFYETYLP